MAVQSSTETLLFLSEYLQQLVYWIPNIITGSLPVPQIPKRSSVSPRNPFLLSRCPPLPLGVCLNSCPLSRWCYLTISPSATPFSFCLQYFQASGSFPMNLVFTSGGPSIGASASVLPMNIQGWLPLGLIGLISLLSKVLSRIFSSTTITKHQLSGTQLSVWSNSHIHTFLLEKQ